MGRGYPLHVWTGEIPHPADGEYPIQDQDRGVPPSRIGWGTVPVETRWGYPPIQDWMEHPPPPHSRTCSWWKYIEAKAKATSLGIDKQIFQLYGYIGKRQVQEFWRFLQYNCNLTVRLHRVSVSTQSQRCDDACDMVLIEIDGNQKESFQNGVAIPLGGTPLRSMRAMLQASSRR